MTRQAKGTAMGLRAGLVAGLLAVVAVAAVAVAPTASAVTAAQRAEQVRYAKETINLGNYQFMQRKTDFVANGCATVAGCRKPVPYNEFDWSTDSCSRTPSSWRTLFDPACQQHDFGYRNFGKGLTLGRNESTRAWIDDRFRTEMKAICNYKFSNWTQYANLQACFKEADVMYTAVRVANSWA